MQGFWKDSTKHFSKSKRKHILKQYWKSEYSKDISEHEFSFNSPVFSVNNNSLAVYPSSPGQLTNFFTNEVYSFNNATIEDNIAIFNKISIPVQLFFFFQSYFSIYPSFKNPLFYSSNISKEPYEEKYPFEIISFKNITIKYFKLTSTHFSFKWSQERSNYIKYQNKDMGYIDHFFYSKKKPYRISANRKTRRRIKEFNSKIKNDLDLFESSFQKSHSLEKSIKWAYI